MPSTVTRKSYPPETDKSKSSVVDDSKKKTSLLQDNSWIKKDVNDEKVVDQTSNFGRTVLGRFRSTENLTSPSEKKTSTTITSSTTVTDSVPSKNAVQSLTKRFSTSQDQLDSSSTSTTSSKDGTKTTVTTSRTSVVKSPTKTKTFSEKIFTDTKTTTSEDIKTVKSVPPSSPTKTTKREAFTVTTSEENKVKEGNKTVKPVTIPSSPTKTTKRELFTVTTSEENKVKEGNKTVKPVIMPTSPTKTTKKEIFTVTTSEENKVQDGNKTSKSVTIPTSPTKNTKTETVTVTTFQDTIVKEDRKSVKSTPPTTIISDKTYTNTTPTSKTSSHSFISKSSTEDQLFDTLIPTPIKEANAADTRPKKYLSENVSTEYVKTSSAMSDRGSTKTYTATTYSDSRSEVLLDTYKSSRSSMETLYTTPERKIYVEKDICTYCQKPILYDTKMILEDVDIKCHATCFKCDVCKSSLGHLKAGDSMWVYRRNVHCDGCFGIIKGKWHR